MKVIDHRRFEGRRRGFWRWMRPVLWVVGVVVGVFALANVVMVIAYRGRMLPNYSIAAIPVGNVPFNQLDDRVPVDQLLPKTAVLTKDGKKRELVAKDLGVTLDWPATRQGLQQARSWLPVLSLVTHRTIPTELQLDNGRFAAAAKDLEAHFFKAPLPERIAFKGEDFAIAAPEPGYQVNTVQLRQDLLQTLARGKAELTIPVATTNATKPTGQLDSELAGLQKQLASRITLAGGGHSKQLAPADIGRFYEQAGQTMQFSSVQAGKVVADIAKSFGMTAVNQNEAVSAAQYAILTAQPVTFALADQSTKVYRYCVDVREVDSAVLPEYKQKLAAVYGDPRGWNGAGVTLVYAESGCDYTAWLSAPGSMASFGGVCDSYYSCRSGTNVVVNYDRWKGATDPWNKAGGSLEDYRAMVINHETGHWLGFGHRNCPGPGQPAPVMQQQSISLQGCTFNPWPTPAEITTLKNSVGM